MALLEGADDRGSPRALPGRVGSRPSGLHEIPWPANQTARLTRAHDGGPRPPVDSLRGALPRDARHPSAGRLHGAGRLGAKQGYQGVPWELPFGTLHGRSRDVGERGRPQLSSGQHMQLAVEALLVQLSRLVES